MGSARPRKHTAVQVTQNFRNIDVSLSKLEKLVRSICSRFKLSKITVSIAIVDDSEIRRINKKFLNRKNPCDCLSFDLSDDENGKSFELVVNGEMAVREATVRGHSSEAELALYVTHCLLHNLGFNDSTKSNAKKMHEAEDEILQQLGYGLVYNSWFLV